MTYLASWRPQRGAPGTSRALERLPGVMALFLERPLLSPATEHIESHPHGKILCDSRHCRLVFTTLPIHLEQKVTHPLNVSISMDWSAGPTSARALRLTSDTQAKQACNSALLPLPTATLASPKLPLILEVPTHMASCLHCWALFMSTKVKSPECRARSRHTVSLYRCPPTA